MATGGRLTPKITLHSEKVCLSPAITHSIPMVSEDGTTNCVINATQNRKVFTTRGTHTSNRAQSTAWMNFWHNHIMARNCWRSEIVYLAVMLLCWCVLPTYLLCGGGGVVNRDGFCVFEVHCLLVAASMVEVENSVP